VGFSPDGARVITGGQEEALKLWNVQDGKVIAPLKGHKTRVSALAMSLADGNIVSGDMSGEMRLWTGVTAPSCASSPISRPWGAELQRRWAMAVVGIGAEHGLQCLEVASGGAIVSYKNHDNLRSPTSVPAAGRDGRRR
jgi:WD40 repeat protein